MNARLRERPGANDELTLEIREAGADDLAAVLALYAQPDLDHGKVLSPDEARRVFGRFSLYPDYHLFVAVLDGPVVGTFAMLIMDNLAHQGTPSGVVEDVVVSGALQNRGIHALQRTGVKGRGVGAQRARQRTGELLVLERAARRPETKIER